MKLRIISALNLAVVSASSLLKQGDHLSLVCGKGDWKYCKWEGPQFACDRASTAESDWCNTSLGLRWAQEGTCGIDVVELDTKHQAIFKYAFMNILRKLNFTGYVDR